MSFTTPIPMLTNYNKVLSRVDEGQEAILTNNKVSRYAVVDIDEWQYTKAMLRFLSDMRAVDEEMAQGGKVYSETDCLASLRAEI